MNRTGAVDTVLHIARQIVVRHRHVGPQGVAPGGRHLTQLQYGAHRGPLPERDVRVPHVLEGRDGRTVEARHVLRVPGRRHQRIGLQLAPGDGESALRVGGQTLPPEEEDLPLQEGPVELVPQRGRRRDRQIQAPDLGADRRGLRDELEEFVRPVLPALGNTAQLPLPLVQSVGGDMGMPEGGNDRSVGRGYGGDGGHEAPREYEPVGKEDGPQRRGGAGVGSVRAAAVRTVTERRRALPKVSDSDSNRRAGIPPGRGAAES